MWIKFVIVNETENTTINTEKVNYEGKRPLGRLRSRWENS
jgi:hypothetical protein